MSVVDDTRKVLQDFLAPEMRATNARLDGIDRRFDAVDKRIDSVDRRIDELKTSVEKKFENLETNLAKRFDSLDKQFVEERKATVNAIERMMRDLNVYIDLAITRSKLAEYEAKAINKESQH